MIALSVKRTLLIVAAAMACYLLAEEYDPLTAVLTWAGATAAACGLGTVLLRTSPVGRVTWRNRLAAYLIPWGWRRNGGRLWPVPLVSWAVWMAAGVSIFLLRAGEERPGVGFQAALFAAWAVDAAAFVYLLGSVTRATPGSPTRPVWVLAAGVAGVIAASVSLYSAGLPSAALLVAGGPPVAAGGCFALVMIVLIALGRKVRWN